MEKWQWEIDKPNRRKISKAGKEIFYQFEIPGEPLLKELCYQFSYGYFEDNIKTDKEEDKFNNMLEACIFTAFGFGYACGQLFDVASPEVKKDAGFIQRELTRRGLFNYLPREKTATV